MKWILQWGNAFVVIFWLLTGVILPAGALSAQDVAIRDDFHPAVVRITGHLRPTAAAEFTKFVERSGFIVDEKGLIFTVYEPFISRDTRRLCEKFDITFADGRRGTAEMVSVDVVLNLAILRIREPGRYPVMNIARAAELRSGESVFALAGKGSGGGQTRFSGRIRAQDKSGIYEGGFADMLINSVMTLPEYAYGGPLVTPSGEVIGMNVKFVHSETESANTEEEHALPMDAILPVYEVLLSYPTFEQNWLGFNVRRISVDERKLVRRVSQHQGGVVVDWVWPNTPAARADFRPGDVITEMDGQPLLTTTQLKWRLYKLAENATVSLTLLRNGQVFTRQVQVEKRPRWAAL